MRQPFQYPTGCTGPVVDIDFGFTLCDGIMFTTPQATHMPKIDPPDANPPPFCPCIPTISESTVSGAATFDVGGNESKFDIKIVPMTSDCCNPEYKFEFDLKVPCMPFSMVVTQALPSSLFTGSMTMPNGPLKIVKDPATCRFLFNLDVPSTQNKYGIALFEKGEGVQFITCCSGTGYIGLDATMFYDSDDNRWYIGLIHEVNLKIPLLGRMADYDQYGCAAKLSPSTQTMIDPWGSPVHWRSNSNVANPVLKYSKKQT